MSEQEASKKSGDQLDALLSDGGQPGKKAQADELDAMLEQAKPRTASQKRHDEALEASKGELKRAKDALEKENEGLKERVRRSEGIFKLLFMLVAFLAVTNGLTLLYVKSQDRRAVERAFKLIDLRELKFLAGNVFVLDQFQKGLDQIAAKVVGMEGIDDEERKYRIKTLQMVKAQNDQLINMYRTRMQEAEAEKSRGPSFSYKDPFLKKEIDIADANGGFIDMEALQKEIAQNYDLEGTIKSLEGSMLSPVPLASQLKDSVEKKKVMDKVNSGLAPQQPGGGMGMQQAPSLGGETPYSLPPRNPNQPQ